MANFCTQCGSPISGGAKFCTACGTPVAAAGIAHSMAAPPVKAQPVYQQPAPTPRPMYQQPAPMPQPMYQQPQYGRNIPPRYAWPVPQKKKKGFLPLFLLIWAGLLYLGWCWVPDAVKDAQLPIVPVVSEEEITAEQLEEYAAIDAMFAPGTLGSSEETGEPEPARHSWPVWIYGEKPGEEEK